MPEPAASRQPRPRFQPAPSPARWYGRPISVWPASSGNGRTPDSTPTPGPPRHPELDEASRNVLRTAVPMLLHKPVGQLEPKRPGWPDSWSSPAAAGVRAQSYRDRARLPSPPAASSGGRSLVASQLVGQLVARFTDAGLPRPPIWAVCRALLVEQSRRLLAKKKFLLLEVHSATDSYQFENQASRRLVACASEHNGLRRGLTKHCRPIIESTDFPCISLQVQPGSAVNGVTESGSGDFPPDTYPADPT